MIQSVNRALDILLCISDRHGEPVTISELAESTGLNMSTCCHLVETLTERGFLDRISRSHGYVLGVYAYNLTRFKDFHSDVIGCCRPILKWLQNKTGCTVVLANLIRNEKFILNYADSPSNSLKDKGELYKGTLYDSATGRAMLATMSEREIYTLVEDTGLPKEEEWPGITSAAELVKELKSISPNRIFKVDTSTNPYICKLGVALNTYKNEKFAIGIDVKKDAIPSKEEIKSMEKAIIIAANEINRRLKFEVD